MKSETKHSVKTTTNTRHARLLTTARLLLGRSLGFRDCLPATLDELIAKGQLRELSKGEILVHTGQHFAHLGLIVEGSLEISHVRHDGHRHLIHFLQPGDVMGLMCLVDGQPHVNDLTARGNNTAILMIPGALIAKLKQQDFTLGRAFEVQLAFRSRLLYERIAANPSMPLENRLARLLIMLSSLHGYQRPQGILVDVKMSQADLADWLGVSRQRINLAVQQLKTEGLINLSYSSIIITNIAGLSKRPEI